MFCTIAKSILLNALQELKSFNRNMTTVRLTASLKSRKCTVTASSETALLQFELHDAAVNEDADFCVTSEGLKLASSCVTGNRVVLSLGQDSLLEVTDEQHRSPSRLATCRSNLVPAIGAIPREAESIAVPTNFPTMINKAMLCASTAEERVALQGVSLSAKGIACSDGRQLFHLPLPLPLKSGVILPPLAAFARLSNRHWNSFHFFACKNSSRRKFLLSGEDFRLEGDLIDKEYPNYFSVIPDQRLLDTSFELASESVKPFQSFLKAHKPDVVWNLKTLKGILAISNTENASDSVSLPVSASREGASLNLQNRLLLTLVALGYNGLRFSSRQVQPVMGTGSMGTYVFMPSSVDTPPASPAQASTAIAKRPSTDVVAQHPVEQTNSTNNSSLPTNSNLITTSNNKEKKTMQTTVNPTSVNPTSEPVQNITDPIDAITLAFTEMKTNLYNLEIRLQEATRKLKEVVSQHRQQERAYTEATRKLEKIRLAV